MSGYTGSDITMQGLIEFLARNLVDDPDAVQVRIIRDDRYATVLGLRVSGEDLGKVIGRQGRVARAMRDRKSTRLNSSHVEISYAVFCLKKKKKTNNRHESYKSQ